MYRYLMKKILIFIGIFLILTKEKGVTSKQLFDKMAQFNISPVVSFLFIYDSSNQTSVSSAQTMDIIVENLKGYINMIKIDCNTDDKLILDSSFLQCRPGIRHQLPLIQFAVPQLNQFRKKQEGGFVPKVRPFFGYLTGLKLYEFAVSLMRTFSVQLKTMKQFQKFKKTHPTVPLILYLTDENKKQNISALYKALTANFRHTIAFAHVFSTSQLAQDLKITDYPIFLLNGKTKIQVKPNLQQMIQILNIIKGQPTRIFIPQYDATENFQLNEENIQQLVYKNQQYIMVHVLGDEEEDHPAWRNLMETFGQMCKYFQIKSSQKQMLGVKKTPAIVYFPNNIERKKYQQLIFPSEDTALQIYRKINALIPDSSILIPNANELNRKQLIQFKSHKSVVIYFHTEQIPITYKAITNDARFKDDITFFRMRNPSNAIVQHYQFKQLPSLIVRKNHSPIQKTVKGGKPQTLKDMRIETIYYRGKFIYRDLMDFLAVFSDNFKQREYSFPHLQAQDATKTIKKRRQDIHLQKTQRKSKQQDQNIQDKDKFKKQNRIIQSEEEKKISSQL